MGSALLIYFDVTKAKIVNNEDQEVQQSITVVVQVDENR